MNYKDVINHYPDFPKPGIDFIDIIPFLSNKEAFKQIVSDIDANVHCPNVVTVEARGFLFAAPLLAQSKLVQNIVPIRKKGKLPFAEGDLRGVDIVKEYGADKVYYRLSDIAAGKPEGDTIYLTFLDDILATGGYGTKGHLRIEALVEGIEIQDGPLPAVPRVQNLPRIRHGPQHGAVGRQGTQAPFGRRFLPGKQFP